MDKRVAPTTVAEFHKKVSEFMNLLLPRATSAPPPLCRRRSHGTRCLTLVGIACPHTDEPCDVREGTPAGRGWLDSPPHGLPKIR